MDNMNVFYCTLIFGIVCIVVAVLGLINEHYRKTPLSKRAETIYAIIFPGIPFVLFLWFLIWWVLSGNFQNSIRMPWG